MRQFYIALQSPHRADVTLLRTCQIILGSKVYSPSHAPTVCNLHGQSIFLTGLEPLNLPLPKPVAVLWGMREGTNAMLALVPGGFDAVLGELVSGLVRLSS